MAYAVSLLCEYDGSEFDDVYETQEGFLLQFNQIVKLQARVKTLENTLEYLARRPSLSDGR